MISWDPAYNQTVGYVATAILMFFWIFLVLLGFSFFARCAFTSGEKFRLSLGFSLASVLFPPFACVPICLNAR